LCIGIDASAEALRETSFRASRKAPRGGVPNARFVRAAAERLPAAVWGIADEIYILMPWGSLLRAVLGREAQILRGIARAGKPGALVHVRVNASILRDERLAATIGLHTPWDERTEMRLRDGYAVAGLRVIRLAWEYIDTRTSWGRRLGSGRPVEVLAIDAAIR
jgi:16S rRNA (adenine(1408)-N(1))-methyltransferase